MHLARYYYWWLAFRDHLIHSRLDTLSPQALISLSLQIMLLLDLPHVIGIIVSCLIMSLLQLLHLHNLLLYLKLLSGLVLTHNDWAIVVGLKVRWLLIDRVSQLSHDSRTLLALSFRSVWLLLLELRVGSVGELDLENLVVDMLHHLRVCAIDSDLPVVTSGLCTDYLLLHVGRVLLGLVSCRAIWIWSKLRVSASYSLVCVVA